jgi:dynactin-5
MMYFPAVEYSPSEYIKTSTGNIVSRKAQIVKPAAVELPGGRCIVCDDVVIHGDLAPVQINKYSRVGKGTVLRPCHIVTTKPGEASTIRFVPMTIGSHTSIGSDCIIEAAVIGMGCTLGDGCIISPRAVLKDFVRVEDNAVVLPDAVLAPFSIVAGRPGVVVGEQPESASTLAVTDAVKAYKCWRPLP